MVNITLLQEALLTYFLAKVLPLDRDFQTIKKDLASLNRYAVIVRYPGIRIDVETAEAALQMAGRVQKFVRKKLGIK